MKIYHPPLTPPVKGGEVSWYSVKGGEVSWYSVKGEKFPLPLWERVRVRGIFR